MKRISPRRLNKCLFGPGLRRKWLAAGLALLPLAGASAARETVLFIGNSFTFGAGTPVQQFRSQSVHDLNHDNIGGVPALYKMFTVEAGLDFDVSLETHPGVGLDYHLAHKRDLIIKPWDHVVMHGYSTLDQEKPGDPHLLIKTVEETAELLHRENARVDIYLLSTWSRADLTYPEGKPWHGQPIEKMALDIRSGYDAAAANSSRVHAVIPVGQAWNRAMARGVADPNPYDGTAAGQVDLWGKDHYHASTAGYYLDALVVFGELTQLDPKALGKNEQAAAELGIDPSLVTKLEDIASAELGAGKNTPTLRSFTPIRTP